jgi:RNA polymerase sigma-70 factor (ECF subfamily)
LAAERPLSMAPEEFQEFYAQTARPLKSYVMRLIQNAAIADEVLQESYYKFLRANIGEVGERERKNYLFRIATNLVNDMYRGRAESALPINESVRATADESTAGQVQVRGDVGRVLGTLQPRERELVWLAYVEGSSHREIAEIMGLREVSIRPMLFRVRQKLGSLLKSIGYCERMVM